MQECASAWHHGVVTEPTSDALFGFDGTELSPPPPDPSGPDGWRNAPELPPLTLPAFPDARAVREAIAAASGESSTNPVDQDSPATPPSLAATPSNGQAHIPQAGGSQVGDLQAHVTAPGPHQSAPLSDQVARPPAAPPRASGPSQRPPPIVPAPIQPAHPPQRQRGGLGYRPALAAGIRTPVQFRNLRRRVGRQAPRVQRQTRSNGGASVFFVIASIIFVVLAVSIVLGIAQALSRLLP